MKRKLFVIFLSMVFVFSLFGCGGTKGGRNDCINPSDFKENIEENVIYTFKKGDRTYYYKNVERENGQIKFNQNSAFWTLNEFVTNLSSYGGQLSSYTFSTDPLDQFKKENSCTKYSDENIYQYRIIDYYYKTNGYSYSLENTGGTVVLVEMIKVTHC